MVSFLKQLAWSILHVISPVWIKEAHKYNILNKHKMKEYLTLNWSQGVIIKMRKLQVELKFCPRVMQCFDTSAEAKQLGMKKREQPSMLQWEALWEWFERHIDKLWDL